MEKNYRLKQVSDNLILGKGGAQFKRSSALLEIRDNADSAYAKGRALAPVGNDDLVTKLWALENISSRSAVNVSNDSVVDVETLPSTIPVGSTYLYDKASSFQLIKELRIAAASGHKIIAQGNVIEGTGLAADGAELITNGTFNTDLSGWAFPAGTSGITWSAGVLSMAVSSARAAEQAFTTVIGETYSIFLNYNNITNSTGPNTGCFFHITTGSNATGTLHLTNNVSPGTGPGILTGSFIATTTTTYIYLGLGDSADAGTFDNVSIKRASSGYVKVINPRKSFFLTGINSTTWQLSSDLTASEAWGLVGRNSWVLKTAGPVVRAESSGFSLNGFGYTTGGLVAGVQSNLHSQYNDSADTWSAKAVNPTARYDMSGFTLNGFGYVTSGFGASLSNVHTGYNDSANTWATLAVNPTSRFGLTGFALNGFGYTTGGNTNPGVSAVHTKYNDSANTWATVTAVLTGRYVASAFALNSYGYFVCGNTGSSSLINNMYNDLSNSWVVKTSNPVARFGTSSFVINGYGYVTNGQAGTPNTTVATEYNDALNLWTYKAPSPFAKRYASGIDLNGYGYSNTGFSTVGLDTTEQFN